MVINPSVAFCSTRIVSDGLVANMVVRSCGVKLSFYAEYHCGIGGKIISRLEIGVFAGLIYSWMVLTD